MLKIPKHTRHLSPFVEDFYTKYSEAQEVLVRTGIPSWVLDPQRVLLDIPRVAKMIYRGHYTRKAPELLLDGLIRHALWSALLDLMYPGGDSTAVLIGEYGDNPQAQGHPDYLHREMGLVFELKTVGYGKWKSIKKKADPRHVKQLKTYMAFAGVVKGVLIYQERDSLEVIVVEVSTRGKRKHRAKAKDRAQVPSHDGCSN